MKSGFSPDYPFNNGFNLYFAKNKVLEIVEIYFQNLPRKNPHKMENLQNYYKKLSRAQDPEGTCNTLWLPVSTSNRNAVLNLNHTLIGFDDEKKLWGSNRNCSTHYRIIAAPEFLKNEDLQSLGEKVNEKFDNSFPSWNNALRASNADLIEAMLEELKKQDLIAPIQAIQAIEKSTNLKEKELIEILIGRVLVSGHFNQAIEKAVKSGISPDVGFDGEIESCNEVAATNSVIETLKKYFL